MALGFARDILQRTHFEQQTPIAKRQLAQLSRASEAKTFSLPAPKSTVGQWSHSERRSQPSRPVIKRRNQIDKTKIFLCAEESNQIFLSLSSHNQGTFPSDADMRLSH
jgi:hypothetical protein